MRLFAYPVTSFFKRPPAKIKSGKKLVANKSYQIRPKNLVSSKQLPVPRKGELLSRFKLVYAVKFEF